MYDLSNTVQCIGRLRSSQRHAQSQVRQCVTPRACLLNGPQYDLDEEKFETCHNKFPPVWNRFKRDENHPDFPEKLTDATVHFNGERV